MKMGEGRAVETSARASSKAFVSEIARSDAAMVVAETRALRENRRKTYR